MDFIKKMNTIQKVLGITQKELGAKLGISQISISRYMTGKRKPDIITIQKLINHGVSPLFLFYGSDIPFNKDFDDFTKTFIQKEKELAIKLIEKELEILKNSIAWMLCWNFKRLQIGKIKRKIMDINNEHRNRFKNDMVQVYTFV